MLRKPLIFNQFQQIAAAESTRHGGADLCYTRYRAVLNGICIKICFFRSTQLPCGLHVVHLGEQVYVGFLVPRPGVGQAGQVAQVLARKGYFDAFQPVLPQKTLHRAQFGSFAAQLPVVPRRDLAVGLEPEEEGEAAVCGFEQLVLAAELPVGDERESLGRHLHGTGAWLLHRDA